MMDYYSDSALFQKSYEEALKRNEETLDHLKIYKKELEDVSLNLIENQKHLFQNIMVPLGSKALIRGKLMHTNEVFVSLGDRWFVKTSATNANEICNRMIKRCNENIAEFEKETNLLTSNLELPQELELFPTGDIKDIIEPYDEEYEKKWKENHLKNVRKYKKQEAASRLSDADLFAKLDKLEKQELDAEKSDVIDLVVEEAKGESYNDDGSDEVLDWTATSEEQVNTNVMNYRTTKEGLSISELDYSCSKVRTKKRVSFSDVDLFQSHPDDQEDIIVIRFKPSDKNPIYSCRNLEEINSPADIYNQYLSNMNIRKPILKNKHDTLYLRNEVINNDEISHEEISMVLGDIVEKSPVISEKLNESTRPVSRFKQFRVLNRTL